MYESTRPSFRVFADYYNLGSLPVVILNPCMNTEFCKHIILQGRKKFSLKITHLSSMNMYHLKLNGPVVITKSVVRMAAMLVDATRLSVSDYRQALASLLPAEYCHFTPTRSQDALHKSNKINLTRLRVMLKILAMNELTSSIKFERVEADAKKKVTWRKGLGNYK